MLTLPGFTLKYSNSQVPIYTKPSTHFLNPPPTTAILNMFSSKLILLGLLSASVNLVGAIDIYLYNAAHSCSGTAHVCTNVNPNTCCGQGGNDAHSLAWRAKPSSWSLDLRGHSDGNCNRESMCIRGS